MRKLTVESFERELEYEGGRSVGEPAIEVESTGKRYTSHDRQLYIHLDVSVPADKWSDLWLWTDPLTTRSGKPGHRMTADDDNRWWVAKKPKAFVWVNGKKVRADRRQFLDAPADDED